MTEGYTDFIAGQNRVSLEAEFARLLRFAEIDILQIDPKNIRGYGGLIILNNHRLEAVGCLVIECSGGHKKLTAFRLRL